uniref:granulin a n=1 Tax=Epinephelus lanceolatus TaxID=310571 RepID=UPI001444B091|nr:granulin a [Epinephelus lanceolatus]
MQRWVVICCALLALVGADECPDGGRCKDSQTCCYDPANGYECCPFAQAECCGDHMHCCPAGTVCDTATSSCLNSTGSIPWVERASADQPRHSKSFRMIKTHMGEDDDNICPDWSRCPPEFSCLKALTRFGCCPLAQGVPCSDGKHCCPEGHQCSADSRSCIEKELVTTVLCSDGISECPDETTCCETPEGKWGCCPLPKAVCCEDKTHCCPEDSTCDVEQSKCISLSTKKQTPMWAKLPARIRADWENQKEDEKVTAETAVDGGSEKTPKVTTVNEVPPSQKEVSVSSTTKAAASEMFIVNQSNDVPCDDTVACEDGTTCCKTKEGGWACCPLPEAVCCEDMLHCCPKGKKCNLVAQTCDDDTCSVPWVQKVPTIPRQDAQVGNVTCDSTYSCPDGSTCCKTTTGEWACCPLPEAVCCEDHEHCCPTGTTCDLAEQTCNGASGSTPMKQKIPAFATAAPTTVAPMNQDQATSSKQDEKKEPETEEVTKAENNDDDDDEENKEVGSIQCDPHTSCPQSATCCFMTSSQKWGCCPLPRAVCCADGNHCCPNQYKCDESQTSCIKGEVVIPWYTKLPATISNEADPSSVQCEEQTQCPEHTTCCQLPTGDWGCCPLPNAVCCPDKEHCCPQGYTCNMASNSCQKVIMLQLETVPLIPVYQLEHQPPPNPSEHKDVQCDEQTSCPDGNTCCRTSTTTWGCCPLPNAVCCSDMLHCCPAGYTCTDTGDCEQGTRPHWQDWHVFLGNKKRALLLKPINPAGVHQAIRPKKEAFQAWLGQGSPEVAYRYQLALRAAAVVVHQAKTQMQRWFVICCALLALVGADECPDGGRCKDSQTCCYDPANGYECCPFAQAECCGDHMHCCPAGTVCDTATSSCLNSTGSIPWVERASADQPRHSKSFRMIKTHMGEDDDNICPDWSRCPPEFSCLKSLTRFGCCPLAQGVPCSDGKHCCPEGHQCSADSRSCIEKELVTSVICGDGVTECPSGNTCCKSASGPWGCCPQPQAVCCTDGIHCCPSNYKCEGTTCTRGDVVIPAYTKLPATTSIKADTSLLVKELETNVICGDGVTECPSGNTCCKSASGSWGCCPLPQAVCCTDGIHCCPSNYKCEGTTCTRGDVVIPAYTKLPATTSIKADTSLLVKELETNVICGDGVTECPSGNTCCKSASGSWGCCPLPQAVCCTDGIHCCPSNYKCEGTTCTRGDVVIPAYTKLPATTSIKADLSLLVKELVTNIICGDGITECPSGNTCCENGSGVWGCCPLPQAVCCSNMLHCCPYGYTCTDTGHCIRESRLHWQNWQLTRANKKRAPLL